jgi:hypothetical protein
MGCGKQKNVDRSAVGAASDGRGVGDYFPSGVRTPIQLSRTCW